jgi:hypothetical protein
MKSSVEYEPSKDDKARARSIAGLVGCVGAGFTSGIVDEVEMAFVLEDSAEGGWATRRVGRRGGAAVLADRLGPPFSAIAPRSEMLSFCYSRAMLRRLTASEEKEVNA